MESDTLDNLTLQQQEIEMLQAMFPGPKEVVWEDPSLLLDLEEYLGSNGSTPSYFRSLSFTMNLEVPADTKPGCKVNHQLSISLPTSYPQVSPCVSMICNGMTRSQQSDFNDKLKCYISNLDLGEMILLDIITYIQENISKYCTTDTSKAEAPVKPSIGSGKQTCAWFYMHHIYSKDKRRCIQQWASDLGLTGFLMPGKPGVVHVEGDEEFVNEYYDRLKGLNWQKMTCKVMEERKKRIFEKFEEIFFDTHGTRENHMDMGKFFVYLREKGLGDMFKELFGVAGQG